MVALLQYLYVVRKMGIRYTLFRILYALEERTGIRKKQFPIVPIKIEVPELNEWKKKTKNSFFFNNGASVKVAIDKEFNSNIEALVKKMDQNLFCFFSKKTIDIGDRINWHKNYLTGFVYPQNQHWSEISELSEEAGDIKFVWELSRFSFLYAYIRYDQQFKTDHSEKVLGYILDWIEKNPLNQGPNFICSQEISIRLLNWSFALFYYRDSNAITQEIFVKVSQSMYNQYIHVKQNIQFSRIAVRNNHAITETMTLWLLPYLFPFFPNTDRIQKKGKKWFEMEIDYQIFDDGSYLQYSHNYHRVVVQLLTWGIILSNKNNDALSQSVYQKAGKTLAFLLSCQTTSGKLPNYGSNDGALFFPLNNEDYLNYSPQLQALANSLGYELYADGYEDSQWYGLKNEGKKHFPVPNGLIELKSEGYGVINEVDALTFMPCCKNSQRPFQSDTLHLDLWYNGKNLLLDSGSYLYNAPDDVVGNYVGAQAHNTISINDQSQMTRVGRFIWNSWSTCTIVSLEEHDSYYVISAVLSGYKAIRKGITHQRTVLKYKGKPEWKIIDTLNGTFPQDKITLHWHVNPEVDHHIRISSIVNDNTPVNYKKEKCEVSKYYGSKQAALVYKGPVNSREIITTIKVLRK